MAVCTSSAPVTTKPDEDSEDTRVTVGEEVVIGQFAEGLLQKGGTQQSAFIVKDAPAKEADINQRMCVLARFCKILILQGKSTFKKNFMF